MESWTDPQPLKILRGINNVLEFGKHKGQTVQQVMREDSNWLHWALQNIADFKLNRNALLLLPPFKPKQVPEENLFPDIDELNNLKSF